MADQKQINHRPLTDASARRLAVSPTRPAFSEARPTGRRFSISIRFIAFLTSLTLITTSLASAAPVEPHHSEHTDPFSYPALIQIPEEIGTLQEEFQGSPDRGKVILIQDAHAIPEAQKNIQEVIRYLNQHYGVSLIGVEGSSKPFDTQLFKSFPDKERLKEVFEEYQENGELTGPAAAAIGFEQSAERTRLPARQVAHGVKNFALNSRSALGAMRYAEFYGVEDWPLYEEGLSLYQEAMSKEKALTEKLEVRSRKLEEKKHKVYSKELLEADELIEKFYKNEIDLIATLHPLSKIAPPQKSSSLDLLLSDSRTQPTAAALQIEIKKIAQKVQRALKQDHRQKSADRGLSTFDFNAKLQAYRTSQISTQSFALYLEEVITSLCHPAALGEPRLRREPLDEGSQLDRNADSSSQRDSTDFLSEMKSMKVSALNCRELRMTKKLKDHTSHERRLQNIQGTKLMKEFEEYSEGVMEKLMTNSVERIAFRQKQETFGSVSTLYAKRYELYAQTKQLRLLSRLAKLELSRDDWEKIKSTDDRQQSTELRTVDRGLWTSHFSFYRNAELREAAMLKNLASSVERIADRKANFLNAKRHTLPTVLVAGGFHTEGISERLKQAGISYVVIQPKIDALPKDDRYRKLMNGEVSWKDYFEVKNGRVNLYEAFVRAARDRLLTQNYRGLDTRSHADPRISVYRSATDPRLAKLWRDQLIRDLAAEGRIEKAGEYTKYIDELLKIEVRSSKLEENKESFSQHPTSNFQLLSSKVEAFLSGLYKLKAAKQLNEQNIFNLIKPAFAINPISFRLGEPDTMTQLLGGNAQWGHQSVDGALLKVTSATQPGGSATYFGGRNQTPVTRENAKASANQWDSETATSEERVYKTKRTPSEYRTIRSEVRTDVSDASETEAQKGNVSPLSKEQTLLLRQFEKQMKAIVRAHTKTAGISRKFDTEIANEPGIASILALLNFMSPRSEVRTQRLKLTQALTLEQTLTLKQSLTLIQKAMGDLIIVDKEMILKFRNQFVRALNFLLAHELGHAVVNYDLTEKMFAVTQEKEGIEAKLLSLFSDPDEQEAAKYVLNEVTVDRVGFELTKHYVHPAEMPLHFTLLEQRVYSFTELTQVFVWSMQRRIKDHKIHSDNLNDVYEEKPVWLMHIARELAILKCLDELLVAKQKTAETTPTTIQFLQKEIKDLEASIRLLIPSEKANVFTQATALYKRHFETVRPVLLFKDRPTTPIYDLLVPSPSDPTPWWDVSPYAYLHTLLQRYEDSLQWPDDTKKLLSEMKNILAQDSRNIIGFVTLLERLKLPERGDIDKLLTRLFKPSHPQAIDVFFAYAQGSKKELAMRLLLKALQEKNLKFKEQVLARKNELIDMYNPLSVEKDDERDTKLELALVLMHLGVDQDPKIDQSPVELLEKREADRFIFSPDKQLMDQPRFLEVMLHRDLFPVTMNLLRSYPDQSKSFVTRHLDAMSLATSFKEIAGRGFGERSMFRLDPVQIKAEEIISDYIPRLQSSGSWSWPVIVQFQIDQKKYRVVAESFGEEFLKSISPFATDIEVLKIHRHREETWKVIEDWFEEEKVLRWPRIAGPSLKASGLIILPGKNFPATFIRLEPNSRRSTRLLSEQIIVHPDLMRDTIVDLFGSVAERAVSIDPSRHTKILRENQELVQRLRSEIRNGKQGVRARTDQMLKENISIKKDFSPTRQVIKARHLSERQKGIVVDENLRQTFGNAESSSRPAHGVNRTNDQSDFRMFFQRKFAFRPEETAFINGSDRFHRRNISSSHSHVNSRQATDHSKMRTQNGFAGHRVSELASLTRNPPYTRVPDHFNSRFELRTSRETVEKQWVGETAGRKEAESKKSGVRSTVKEKSNTHSYHKLLKTMLKKIVSGDRSPKPGFLFANLARMIREDQRMYIYFLDVLEGISFSKSLPRVSWKMHPALSDEYREFVQFLKNPSELQKFIFVITLLRQVYPEGISLQYPEGFSDKSDMPPYAFSQSSGIYFPYKNYKIFPISQSFRRIIIELTGTSGRKHLIEVKFPGQQSTRDMIQPEHYTIARKYHQKYPGNNMMPRPVALITARGRFNIFGINKIFKDSNPMRLAIFRYEDGKRIARINQGYLESVMRKTGLGERRQLAWIVLQVMAIAAKILDLEYVGNSQRGHDFHLENFRLLLDGRVQFVADFGAFQKRTNLTEKDKKEYILDIFKTADRQWSDICLRIIVGIHRWVRKMNREDKRFSIIGDDPIRNRPHRTELRADKPASEFVYRTSRRTDEKVLGAFPRQRVHTRPSEHHRATAIIAMTPRKEAVIFQRRAFFKEVFPGYLDIHGGHVQFDEEHVGLPDDTVSRDQVYENTAFEETEQELPFGIQRSQLKRIRPSKKTDIFETRTPENNENRAVFTIEFTQEQMKALQRKNKELAQLWKEIYRTVGQQIGINADTVREQAQKPEGQSVRQAIKKALAQKVGAKNIPNYEVEEYVIMPLTEALALYKKHPEQFADGFYSLFDPSRNHSKKAARYPRILKRHLRPSVDARSERRSKGTGRGREIDLKWQRAHFFKAAYRALKIWVISGVISLGIDFGTKIAAHYTLPLAHAPPSQSKQAEDEMVKNAAEFIRASALSNILKGNLKLERIHHTRSSDKDQSDNPEERNELRSRSSNRITEAATFNESLRTSALIGDGESNINRLLPTLRKIPRLEQEMIYRLAALDETKFSALILQRDFKKGRSFLIQDIEDFKFLLELFFDEKWKDIENRLEFVDMARDNLMYLLRNSGWFRFHVQPSKASTALSLIDRVLGKEHPDRMTAVHLFASPLANPSIYDMGFRIGGIDDRSEKIDPFDFLWLLKTMSAEMAKSPMDTTTIERASGTVIRVLQGLYSMPKGTEYEKIIKEVLDSDRRLQILASVFNKNVSNLAYPEPTLEELLSLREKFAEQELNSHYTEVTRDYFMVHAFQKFPSLATALMLNLEEEIQKNMSQPLLHSYISSNASATINVLEADSRLNDWKKEHALLYQTLKTPDGFTRIAQIASLLRNYFPYQLRSPSVFESPVAYAIKHKLYVPLEGGYFLTPLDGGFRRATLFKMDSSGHISWIGGIKMFGKLDHRRYGGLHDRDVYREVREHFPASNLQTMLAIFEWEGPREGKFYGGEVEAHDISSMEIDLFDQGRESGWRLEMVTRKDLKEIAQRYAQYEGNPDAVASDIAGQVLEDLAQQHSLGFVGSNQRFGSHGTDYHLGNYRLIFGREGIKVRGVADLGTPQKIEEIRERRENQRTDLTILIGDSRIRSLPIENTFRHFHSDIDFPVIHMHRHNEMSNNYRSIARHYRRIYQSQLRVARRHLAGLKKKDPGSQRGWRGGDSGSTSGPRGRSEVRNADQSALNRRDFIRGALGFFGVTSPEVLEELASSEDLKLEDWTLLFKLGHFFTEVLQKDEIDPWGRDFSSHDVAEMIMRKQALVARLGANHRLAGILSSGEKTFETTFIHQAAKKISQSSEWRDYYIAVTDPQNFKLWWSISRQILLEEHFDHVSGIDPLREFKQAKSTGMSTRDFADYLKRTYIQPVQKGQSETTRPLVSREAGDHAHLLPAPSDSSFRTHISSLDDLARLLSQVASRRATQIRMLVDGAGSILYFRWEDKRPYLRRRFLSNEELGQVTTSWTEWPSLRPSFSRIRYHIDIPQGMPTSRIKAALQDMTWMETTKDSLRPGVISVKVDWPILLEAPRSEVRTGMEKEERETRQGKGDSRKTNSSIHSMNTESISADHNQATSNSGFGNLSDDIADQGLHLIKGHQKDPQKNNGKVFRHRKSQAIRKIQIFGDQNQRLTFDQTVNLGIRSYRQSVPYVLDFVSQSGERILNRPSQIGVNQKFHGISGRLAKHFFFIRKDGRIINAGPDVFIRNRSILLLDPFKAHTRGQGFQNGVDGGASIFETGLPPLDIGARNNALFNAFPVDHNAQTISQGSPVKQVPRPEIQEDHFYRTELRTAKTSDFKEAMAKNILFNPIYGYKFWTFLKAESVKKEDWNALRLDEVEVLQDRFGLDGKKAKSFEQIAAALSKRKNKNVRTTQAVSYFRHGVSRVLNHFDLYFPKAAKRLGYQFKITSPKNKNHIPFEFQGKAGAWVWAGQGDPNFHYEVRYDENKRVGRATVKIDLQQKLEFAFLDLKPADLVELQALLRHWLRSQRGRQWLAGISAPRTEVRTVEIEGGGKMSFDKLRMVSRVELEEGRKYRDLVLKYGWKIEEETITAAAKMVHYLMNKGTDPRVKILAARHRARELSEVLTVVPLDQFAAEVRSEVRMQSQGLPRRPKTGRLAMTEKSYTFTEQFEMLDRVTAWLAEKVNKISGSVAVGFEMPGEEKNLEDALSRFPKSGKIYALISREMKVHSVEGVTIQPIGQFSRLPQIYAAENRNRIPRVGSRDAAALNGNPNVFDVDSIGAAQGLDPYAAGLLDKVSRSLIGILITKHMASPEDLRNSVKRPGIQAALIKELFTGYESFANQDMIRIDAQGRVLVHQGLLQKFAQEFLARAEVRKSA